MATPKHKSRTRYETNNHARLLNFSCFANQPFLSSQRTCQWTCDAIARARDLHTFELWAYVLMPTHVHLLVWPTTPVPTILRSIKQSVANRAVARARKHHPQTLARMAHLHPAPTPDGKVTHRFWQRGGGYDRNLWSPAHIFDAIDYIHMNPVRAGLCADPGAWRWSSAWAAHAGAPETDASDGVLRVDRAHLPAQPR